MGDLGLARRDFLKRLAADPFDADSRLGLALCEGCEAMPRACKPNCSGCLKMILGLHELETEPP